METEYEISLYEIIAILSKRVWLIILCTIIGAGTGFGVSKYLVKPTYASKISMYINNNKNRVDTALNINDLNVSQKLVTTYIEILKSEKVLNKTIEQMQLPYTSEELRKMIVASSVNGTEILEIKVTAHDPSEAANIANTLGEIAPVEIIRVVKAGEVQLIDEAIPNHEPVAPNIVINTLIAALAGFIFSALISLLISVLDISIKSADDLQKRYNLPVIGSIPDILEADKVSK